MTLKEKILIFLKEENISKTDFYNDTGIAASNFKGSGMNSELGGTLIVKILTRYSNLSPDWLLLGKGSMTRDGASGSQSANIEAYYKLYKEMENKADRLLEENGALKYKINKLENPPAGDGE